MNIKFFIIVFLFIDSAIAVPEGKVRILQNHKRHRAFQNLISYIATSDQCFDGKKVYTCPEDLEYDEVDCAGSETDCFNQTPDRVDVIYSPSANWNLKNFTKVNLDLFNNILSYRVPVLLKKNISTFKMAYSKKELKKLPLVFNQNWRDFQILQSEGYNLISVDSYDQINKNLLAGKGIYSLRGVSEVSFESNFFGDDGFEVLLDHLVFYPFSTHLFINHVNNPFALTFFHRILYFQNFNPELLRSFFAEHLPLDEKSPCQIYDGRTNLNYLLDKCIFEKLKHIEKITSEKDAL